MNFLADESVDRQIVERLRQDGHSVQYVAEMQPGISDDAVLAAANRMSSCTVTSTSTSTSFGKPPAGTPRRSDRILSDC